MIEGGKPLLRQLRKLGLELDQLLSRALEISASRPDLDPEDRGFPDSYLTLALYRLNTTLTRTTTLDESRLNLFHDYKLAPPCPVERVVPGDRLAWILTRAASAAAPGKTIGVGDYLKAIVEISLDEEPEDAGVYGFPGQVMHQTFSVETFLWGLGYSAWTPVEKAPEVGDLLRSLGGREQVQDYQYLMSFDENRRLVLRPTSILDPCSVLESSGKALSGLGLITHFQDQYCAVRPSQLLELEDLINDQRVKESDLQTFFERHPQFFRVWDFRDVYPHVYLTREGEGPLVPDFLLVNPDTNQTTVLDLKLPSARLVARKPNRNRFASAVEEARAQLLEYRDWFEDRHNREKLKDSMGLEIFRPRLGVVIGSSAEFRDALDRQKLASRFPDVEVFTFDDLLRRAQQRVVLINSAPRRP